MTILFLRATVSAVFHHCRPGYCSSCTYFMLIPEPRHCQYVTVLVFVRWPCNVGAW